jgi:hypothetical protein
LFNAPWQVAEWNDNLTGRQSRSLGRAAYHAALADAGMELLQEFTDEGQSHYYSARKAAPAR